MAEGPTAARFQVDPRLATLLGENYRSSEQALKELVDNAWDADASTVQVTLPAPVTSNPIVIVDDGAGMTELEVRQEYLLVANDRRTRKGERTPGKQRLVKGRKGIGKFAGLMVADVMTLETTARGITTTLIIRKEDLLQPNQDLEQVPLPVATRPASPDAHGTTITLTSLVQHLAFPQPERLRQLLVQEYGHQDAFRVTVNGAVVDLEDIPGQTFTLNTELPGAGPVRLRVTVAEGKRPLKHSGIVVRVADKAVGKPTYFGLDEDEDIPAKLCRRIYGEVTAEGLTEADVTADWGAVIENSTAFQQVTGWVNEQLTSRVREVFKQEVSLAKARRQQELNRRLAELPEYRRQMAEEAISRVLAKFYNETEERIDAVLGVMLDAFERDEYWTVVQAVREAHRGDVATFATALSKFGLVDMAVMAQQALRRREILDELDALLQRPETQEKELHRVIGTNLWLLGPEYALVASNRTLESVMEQYLDEKVRSTRGNKRPDLLLCTRLRGAYLLIEFKRPDKRITRDDEVQAIKYRDDLLPRFSPIHILMMGRGRAGGSDPRSTFTDLVVRSYADIVSAARADLEWLLEQLQTPKLDARIAS